jgi:hypothetical protein
MAVTPYGVSQNVWKANEIREVSHLCHTVLYGAPF